MYKDKKMPKINIKPHGITLNSIRSTIAQGLLRTRQTGSAEMKAVGRSLNSALAFYSASVLKGCNAALQPDLFGLLEKEVAEEIFLVNAHFKKWAFFFSLPTSCYIISWIGSIFEIAEFSMLPPLFEIRGHLY